MPRAEFDEAMEALSGAVARGLCRILRPSRSARLFPGGEPARRNLAAEHRVAPGAPLRRPLARRSSRHSLGSSPGRRIAMSSPAGTASGSGIASFLDVRKERGLALLRRMFAESRLFRLVIGEVEKTLCLVDLEIARDYAGLVPDAGGPRRDLRTDRDRVRADPRDGPRGHRGARDRRTVPGLSRPSRAPAADAQQGQPRAGRAAARLSRLQARTGEGSLQVQLAACRSIASRAASAPPAEPASSPNALTDDRSSSREDQSS